MAEWWERRTWNTEVTVSSPVLTTSWVCYDDDNDDDDDDDIILFLLLLLKKIIIIIIIIICIIKWELGKKTEHQMGFEPTTLRDLVGCSNHWATGDSMVGKGQMWIYD